jgi:hypothetical protein
MSTQPSAMYLLSKSPLLTQASPPPSHAPAPDQHLHISPW